MMDMADRGETMGIPAYIDKEEYDPPAQRADVVCECGWGEVNMLIVNMPDECPLCGSVISADLCF
jgi:hypothetical protein